MNNLVCYQVMPKWNINTLPELFCKQHNTKKGTWGKLKIMSGQLKYYALTESGDVIESVIFDEDSDIPLIEPQEWHKVEPLTDDLHCQLSFYCEADSYYQKKYKLSDTHSEVLGLMNYVNSDGNKKVLDLGCGGGRNSLYLQSKGFAVTGFDKNANAINKLQAIINDENLEKITAEVANLHDIALATGEILLENEYDLAISTVVLMFLDEDKVPVVIETMQKHTKVGGYNLIICAMDTEDYPIANYQGQIPFSFGLKTNELSDYYAGWDIKKYNEDVGHLHRVDAFGNPIALRFATIIAQKQP